MEADWGSGAKKRLKVAAAVDNAKDEDVLILDTVNDDVFPYGEAAVSGTKIFLT
jgi:hypothetical protein